MGDAKVEVAEQVLVHEIEPEPAANVTVCRERDLPVAPEARRVPNEVERGWMSLRGVGETGEDVPRRGDDEKDQE